MKKLKEKTAFQKIKKFENKLKNNFPLGTLSGQTAKLLLEIASVGTTTASSSKAPTDEQPEPLQ